ncbi:potassium channel subfamily K member 2-like [Patiria miniata]|uniref:Potassium channel domain-containing protein n=1 Tax=Patiria miniata TaxID=46514 RepID=A0A914AYW2_PATMI|nr:potassium channel subfamily K member 2-like [Patiria miniata]
MKRWQLMLIAWFLFIGYLLAGAFLFRAIEHPEEKLAEATFFQAMEEFLDSHPCISRDELFHYSKVLVAGADRGVVDFNEDHHHGQNTRVDKERSVWDLPNSFFFSATIVTTIGYGDITPQTPMGQLVCMIYGAIGLPLTAWVIGVISRSLTAYWTKALDKADNILLLCLRFARLRKTVMVLLTIVVLYAILLQVPAVVLGYIEKWYTLTAVYYLFITLTTIGFGDLVVGNHPDFTLAARWVLKICMVLYVILGLSLLVALSSAIAERANKAVKKSIVPSNSYQVERPKSKKGRERMNTMLENEIALSHVPNLLSARMTDSCSDFKTADLGLTDAEEAAFEMRSLSNHKEDVPPDYEEIVIDTCLSESNGTLCTVSPTDSSDSKKLAADELSVHRSSTGNGHVTERNGNTCIYTISKDEYGRAAFKSPSMGDHT